MVKISFAAKQKSLDEHFVELNKRLGIQIELDEAGKISDSAKTYASYIGFFYGYFNVSRPSSLGEIRLDLEYCAQFNSWITLGQYYRRIEDRI